MTTKVEWTYRPGTKGETWNPLRSYDKRNGKRGWFCVHVSEGCRNCYAEAMNGWRGNGALYRAPERKHQTIILDEKTLVQPLRWRKPRTAFVCSMTDLFGEFHPRPLIDQIIAVMVEARSHTFMVLTKRPKRMAEYLADPNLAARLRKIVAIRRGPIYARHFVNLPPQNIWFGFSAENVQTFCDRWGALDPIAWTGWRLWCSAEPLLGPIGMLEALQPKIVCDGCEGRFHGYEGDRCRRCDGTYRSMPGLSWVVTGYESGKFARPGHPSWEKSIRTQCHESEVAYFFKQWGSWSPAETRDRRFELISRAGSLYDPRQPEQWHDPTMAKMYWQGASPKSGGHLIDGKEYRAWPS